MQTSGLEEKDGLQRRFFFTGYIVYKKSLSDVFCVDLRTFQVAKRRMGTGKVDVEAVFGKHTGEAPVGAAALRHVGDVVVEELAEQFIPFCGPPLYISTQHCFHLNGSILQSLLQVRYSLTGSSVASSGSGRLRRELMPVLGQFETMTSDSISIQKECGPDNVCIPNLTVQASQ